MTNTTPTPCLSCGRTENDIPLVALRYRGAPAWICSSCLPQLIHQPQRLAGKLAMAETIPAAEHHDE